MSPAPKSVRGFVLLIAAALACNLPAGAGPVATATAPPNPTSPPAPPSATPLPAPTVAPTATFIPPALDTLPLYWFGPLPPMPTSAGRPFTGSDDFLGLFEPEAPWEQAASHIQVFKLYGEWVGAHASEDELRQAVAGIGQRGLALAVEAGPLDPPADCGQGVEFFAGIEQGRWLAHRIRQAGGTIHLIAMDEPYFYGHVYDGPNACHWEVEQIAAEVDEFIQAMRAEFPDILIGDTEPLAGAAGVAEYQAWLQTFREVAGYDLAFLHMDVDWGRPAWADEIKSIEAFGRDFGVPVGLIYNGTSRNHTDQDWLTAAGERAREYEQEAGGQPAHVLFQSWDDHPDFALPETQPHTFTNFVLTYFENPSALGFPRQGPGANLALKKPASASGSTPDSNPALAVDGNPDTVWNSGDGPTQWIEIDLGAAYSIQEIRLTVNQFPAGPTVHRVLGKGPGTGEEFVELHTFEGETSDPQELMFAPTEPWPGIQTVRVETVSSPSWVAWREIAVIDAGP